MSPAHWSPDVAAAGVMALFFIVTIGGSGVRYSRRKRRKFEADQARKMGTIDENRARSPMYAARHAATRPRTSPAVPAPAPRRDQDFRADRKTGDGLAGPSPTTQARQRRPGRVVSAAGDRAPVIWPEPGTAVPVRPQAASHPGRRTAALDALSDTGWMRVKEAQTNQFIHAMRYDGEQYRREYREGLRSRVADGARPREGGPGCCRAPRQAGRIVSGGPRDRGVAS